MVIRTLFAIQKQSSPMSCRDKLWSSAPFFLSKDNQVWWHAEINYGHPHPFCYPETIKFDGMQRQITVICTLFAIQRQSSPTARGEKLLSSAPFSLSRDNQVRWPAKTNYGHPHLFFYPETIKSDCTRRQIIVIRTLFAIRRQSSLMACGDKLWSSAPFLLSKDNQVWWHVETNYGHPHPFCYPETIKSDGTWTQTMVHRTLLTNQTQ